LKTAILYLVREYPSTDDLPVANLAASFQAAVVDVLVEKTRQAAEERGARQVLLAGGVAANALLREQMAENMSIPVLCPPPIHCTDNAACVAAVGWFRLQAGERSGWDLDVVPGLSLVASPTG
jgi:N6-L-threonylcarbamoyladenine synthase